MGSYLGTLSKCTRSCLPLPSLPPPLLLAPQPMEPLPHTMLPQLRSFPLSHLSTNMELLMTTPRTTSRRLRLRMLRAKLLDLLPLLFPMAESRPPPTLLTTTTDSLLRSPMKVPQSTPQSLLLDTDMLPQLMPLPLLTMPKNT